MRPMLLEFPADPTCRTLDRQYMFGDALLVAPVFHDTRAEFYLPEGEWVHLLTGETRQGGRWCFDELDYFGMPLWIRPGGVIPMGADAARVDYDYATDVRLVFGRLDGSTARTVDLVSSTGKPSTRFEITQSGKRVTVASADRRHDFQVVLPWATGADEITGGARVESPAGSVGVTVKATSARLSFVWK